MRAAGLAAILNINSEQNSLRLSPSVRTGPIAQSGENYFIGGSFRLSRPAESVVRIANSTNDCSRPINSAGSDVRIQARISQGIEYTRVEISQLAALAMAHMSPSAVNARVASERVSAHHASRFTNWRAHLATMGDMSSIRRIG
jgi:hypothetical protein